MCLQNLGALVQYQVDRQKRKQENMSTCMNVFLNIEPLPSSNVQKYREAFSDPCQQRY